MMPIHLLDLVYAVRSGDSIETPWEDWNMSLGRQHSLSSNGIKRKINWRDLKTRRRYFLCRKVIRPLPKSYGDRATVTLSPGSILIKNFRSLPAG